MRSELLEAPGLSVNWLRTEQLSWECSRAAVVRVLYLLHQPPGCGFAGPEPGPRVTLWIIP